MGMGNIATTGMSVALSNMEVISNNIANANTYGFKRTTANFADLFPSGNDASSTSIGLGVSLTGTQQDFSTGGPTSTSSPSDLAINGNGFFILKDPAGTTSYTRYGHFLFDQSSGYFLSQTGARLQGFLANNGTVPSGSVATDLKIDTSPVAAKATSNITQSFLNLSSSDAIPSVTPFDPTNTSSYNYTTTTQIFDSLGTSHSLSLYYVKNAANDWTVNAYVDNNSIGAGSLVFTSSGALSSQTGLSSLSFAPGTGAASPQTIDVSMTGATQYGSADSSFPFTIDGYPAGTFQTYQIDQNGLVSAVYSNGQPATVMGQVAIADFTSQQSLQDIGNQSWKATTNSGTAIVNQLNSSNNITQGALELSNVDLATEMVNLINSQNTFQANAQVEQTYNQIMQTVIKL